MNEIQKKIRVLEYYDRLLKVIDNFEEERENNEKYYKERLKEIEDNYTAEEKLSEVSNDWRYRDAQDEVNKAKEDKNIIATIRTAILKLAT